MIFRKSIDQQVVNYCAFRSCQGRILRLAISQPTCVIRGYSVHERNRFATTDVDLAHVRNIKQTGKCTGTQMFVDRSRGILDRHVPAAKLNHSSAEATMSGNERSTFWRWRRRGEIRLSIL